MDNNKFLIGILIGVLLAATLFLMIVAIKPGNVTSSSIVTPATIVSTPQERNPAPPPKYNPGGAYAGPY